MAVNCWDPPKGMVGFVGVTAIDTRVAELTVKTVDSALSLLLMPFRLAEMVEVPSAMVVAEPSEPPVLLIVAVAIVEDSQVTREVISRELLSE